MERIRSALYVDFDNYIGGLVNAERAAAMVLLQQPALLVEGLASLDLDRGVERALLTRRVYLNPNGYVPDPSGGPDSRLAFRQFRPQLMRAGFEVIDCPALTSRHKNAADIRMALDVVDLLHGPVRYDEVILASSDSDFTPLLIKLRAGDHRTMVLTAGMVADPYLAAADRHLDEAAIVALLEPVEPDGPSAGRAPAAPVPASASESVRSPGPAISDDAQDAEAIAAAALAGATEPVHLGQLGNLVHEAVGSEVIRSSKWFGAGSIRAFLLGRFPGWQSEGHLIWDPARHDAPAAQPVVVAAPAPAQPPASVAAPAPQVELPAPMAVLASAVGFPRLPSSTWPILFEVLDRHDASGDFSLSGASIWVRDELVAQGLPVSRKAVNFAIRGCGFGGAPLDAVPSPTRDDLREAFTVSVLDRAGAAGLTVSPDDEAALRRWLAGEG